MWRACREGMLKASAPQKRMRRGSWGFADVLDHLIETTVEFHDGVLGRTCGHRRAGICVFLDVGRSEVGGDCGMLIGRGGVERWKWIWGG